MGPQTGTRKSQISSQVRFRQWTFKISGGCWWVLDSSGDHLPGGS